MGVVSAIEWTDATWNPWRGCDKISPGCAHCYMFTEQRRYGRDPEVVVRTKRPSFNAPLSKKWAEQQQEIRREKGRAMLVFTCSWSDFFHEAADEWRPEAWEVIRQTPGMIYQVLTKRPERIAECLPPDWGDGWPNVWLGTTIENRRFVSRADALRAVPAAVRFISAEPLLGPLIYDDRSANGHYATAGLRAEEIVGDTTIWLRHWYDEFEGDELDLSEIHWLICGGESGAGHRRFDVGWAAALRDACEAAGTAFFLKQLGGHPNKRGGDEALLDGRRYAEMPTPEPLTGIERYGVDRLGLPVPRRPGTAIATRVP